MDAWIERLFSMMRREVTRTVTKLHKPPRMGLVSSYDSKKHAVKVQFQPEGTESGWIPLSAIAVGNGFGVLSAPNIKDQVEVHFHEGDHGVARVVSRHFSKVDTPPELQPGEHAIVHQQGSQIYFQKDGTVLIQGAGSVQTGQVGGGKSGNLSTSSNGESGQQQQGQQTQQAQGKQSITLSPDGTLTVESPKNDMLHIVDSNVHYLISQPKKTKVVSGKGASAIPVMLIDGSPAKCLLAEPDVS